MFASKCGYVRKSRVSPYILDIIKYFIYIKYCVFVRFIKRYRSLYKCRICAYYINLLSNIEMYRFISVITHSCKSFIFIYINKKIKKIG